jgi:hypothetical protein
VFVEALDKCFENVCELDLIFHSDKVRPDDSIYGGEVYMTGLDSWGSYYESCNTFFTLSLFSFSGFIYVFDSQSHTVSRQLFASDGRVVFI